jgi:nicotinate-nucleotide pyrophosphorylase (carboxylating)
LKQQDYITQHILNALQEDLGDGDHSSLSCIPKEAKGRAKLLVKEKGIIAGISIAKQVFSLFDKNIHFTQHFTDGDQVSVGDIVFTLEGASQSILQCERLALNYMQRMSGIATQTNYYVGLVKGTNCKILDTRKTTPGMRIFEKMAVSIGGGHNHRFGLYDMVMIKDNHIDFAGGITQALQKVKKYLSEKNKNLKIEIEARNLNEVKEILSCNIAHRIMLDNFNIDDTITAVKLIKGAAETESSGGITHESIRHYADCGVDYISVGALTHHIKSLDLSLKAY